MTCPDAFTYVDGSCYLVINNAYTWPQAATACEEQGAYLATISSASQARWVYEFAITSYSRAWIGLNAMNNQGQFQWMDGTNATDFFYWASGYPVGVLSEDCVLIGDRAYGKWTNTPCYNVEPAALCMWNSSTVIRAKGIYSTYCLSTCCSILLPHEMLITHLIAY